MTFFWKHLVRIGVTCVLSAGCLSVQAGMLSGKVIRVIDGDTIVLVDKNREQHKVRLAGVDAPEKSQPFGQRSKQQLASSIAGKFVDVRWSKRDRYQRIVGVVLYAPCETCATRDVGLAQIEAGLGWWYRKYASEQSFTNQRRYEKAEQAAKQKHLGLWADPQPVAPWDWRKRKN